MEFPTNSSSSGTDYLSEYRTISHKLKRRFLRRPNLSEASDQFLRLAKRLEAQDEPQYQAACQLAVAKCQRSIGNQQGQVEAYTAAARAAFKAEVNVENINCNSIHQHLTDAINNYCNAIRILEEMDRTAQASGLCLELADRLRQLGKTSEAIRFYQRAANLRSVFVGLEYVMSREKVASCLIDIGDLHNALMTLTEIANITQELTSAGGGSAAAAAGGAAVVCATVGVSVYADIMARCEILRVLLVLLIEPSPQAMSSTYTSVIEKYAWEAATAAAVQPSSCQQLSVSGSQHDSLAGQQSGGGGDQQLQLSCLSEEVFLLMQSLVMAVQVGDGASLAELEDCLIPHLSQEPQQRELLRNLVKLTQQFSH